MPDPKRLHQARMNAAIKLQHLCWDAAHQEQRVYEPRPSPRGGGRPGRRHFGNLSMSL
jgi:hypothetical protein